MNDRIEQELFPFYALDALTEAERAEVENYIATHPEAKVRLDTLMNTTDQLPFAVDPEPPSSEVKANLMARVQADARAQATQVPPAGQPAKTPLPPASISFSERLRRWYGRFQAHPALPALAGVCVLIAVLAVGWGVRQSRLQNDLQSQVTALSTTLENLRTENTTLQIQNDGLRRQIENQDQLLTAYQQPGSLTLAIGDATGSRPEAAGTLTIDPETATAVFVAENLTQLDDSQIYQLWLIRGETPVSAGLFNVDESGQGVLNVTTAAAPGTFDAIGLTIEPAGGSETPNLDQLILLGVVSS